MLKLEDIFVVFHAGTPLEKIALRGINFEVEEGEIVTLVGNNGCGKTTLLKLLAGHIYSNFGKIWLDKRDISCQSLSDRAQFFSFVSSAINIGIAMNLTVAENLALANIHHQTGNILTPAINSETYEAYYEQLKELDFMAIEAVLDEKASDISFIHKQMLALLIALIKGSRFILIDDHTAGLNKIEATALLQATIKLIKEHKVTAIISTDDPRFALEHSDRVIVMSAGQVVSNLHGEKKKKTRVEDLFASFKVIPAMKEVRPSDL